MAARRVVALFALSLALLGLAACGAAPAATQPTAAPTTASAPTTAPAATVASTAAPGVTEAATAAAGQGAISDPFAYCAAVGTVDEPDARYSGPAKPDAVIKGIMKALDMPSDAPAEPFVETTVWRCMGGKLLACNIGANIPCMGKANTDRAPIPAVEQYCKENPSSDGIPAVVTGRETVYEWGCKDGQPTILRQFTQVDAQGFLSAFWYEIAPQS